jgi:hypothetical protein
MTFLVALNFPIYFKHLIKNNRKSRPLLNPLHATRMKTHVMVTIPSTLLEDIRIHGRSHSHNGDNSIFIRSLMQDELI